MRLTAALLLGCLSFVARAAESPAAPAPQTWPAIVAIEFQGNDTTQPKVMLREMLVQVGDPADPALIERSRQYVQDLGLFLWVKVDSEPAKGGVRLVFSVDEKWYILPYPRFSANVEGQDSVGVELRWSNVFGLNHNLRMNALRSDYKKEFRGRESSYSLGYSAPFVFDSPYRVSMNAGHTLSPNSDPVQHDETFDFVNATVSRTFADAGGARSQGTTWGAGLLWQREDREGAGVPPPYGHATALTASYGYRNIRFYTYSEEGVSWRVGMSAAGKGTLSDYSFFAADAAYSRYLHVGSTPHQSLNYSLSAGTFSRGPAEVKVYSFGGSGALRGYPVNSREGNLFYLGSVEFFRPVFRPSVRVGAIFEVGRVFLRSHDFNLRHVDASLGLALRVRLTRFVNLDVDVGYAFPLNGDEGKLFGGRV